MSSEINLGVGAAGRHAWRKAFHFLSRAVRSFPGRRLGLLIALSFAMTLDAQQQPLSPAPGVETNLTAGVAAERLAALQLEMTNAWKRVIQLVNQPVQAYARPANARVSEYSPGWFHAGASRPDFNSVDIRQSQDLSFAKHPYVTSDLNPGVMFLGRDLEFNAMTKYFYTNRSLPKRKLREAEMTEINQLYRVIGRCEAEIIKLRLAGKQELPGHRSSDSEVEAAEPPGNFVEQLRNVPKATRLRYGGMALGALVVVLLLIRLLRANRG